MRLNGNLVLNANGLSEIQNAVIERVAALPSFSASEKGRLVLLTTEGKIYFNDGAAWSALATGGNAASLQTEVDLLEASLGGFFTSTGAFNEVELGVVPVGRTSLTEVIVALDEAIANEIARATAAEVDEAAARAAADIDLQTAIDAEVAARGAADTALQTAIDAEAGTRAAADTALQTALTAEETARIAADSALQTALTAEETARTAADTALQTAIDAEVAARAAAITAEAGTRAAADATLTAAVEAEAARATTAEAAITADMNAKLAGLTWKNSVKALASTNVALTGEQTIDGVVLSAGDRVLVNGQTAQSENGVYVVSADAWARSADMDASTPINEFNSAAVFVEQGATFGDTGWTEVLSVSVVGTDPVSFTQFNGAAGIDAGAGLVKSGNTINIVAADSSITVDADSIKVSAAFSASVAGDIAAAVAAEAADRSAADTALQTAITAEETARIAGDAASLAAVTAEEAARIAAVSAEQAAREAADTALQGAIDAEAAARTTAVSDEAAARAAADTAINTKLGKIYFLYNGASSTSHSVAHNLNQKYASVTVVDAGTDEVIIPQSIVFGDANTLTVTLNAALAIKVVVVAVGF